MQEPTPAKDRLGSIDVLRGIAALSVCWFHFTNGNEAFLSGSWLKSTGSYGWLGVDIFFVISGFIIPYAMRQGGYTLPALPTFAAKRFLRLEPPYLASIFLVLLLNFAASYAPGFAGKPVEFGGWQLLLHLGYLNAFFGYEWLLPIYWTLAIEFQYYFMIALLYLVLTPNRKIASIVCLLLLCGISVAMPVGEHLPKYLGLFVLGLIAFLYRQQQFSHWIAGLLAAVATATLVSVLGAITAVTGLLTALTITFVRLNPPAWVAFFGHISYSLYLLHVPIGGKVINLGSRYADSALKKVIVLVLAFVATLIASYLFYRFIELPSQRWSSRLKYRRTASVGT